MAPFWSPCWKAEFHSLIWNSPNDDDSLPLKESLGDDGGETAEQMTTAVNDQRLGGETHLAFTPAICENLNGKSAKSAKKGCNQRENNNNKFHHG